MSSTAYETEPILEILRLGCSSGDGLQGLYRVDEYEGQVPEGRASEHAL